MNLKNFLLGLFRGVSLNGELDQVRQAARQDAQLVAGTYVGEFEAEITRLLLQRQRRFVGLEHEPETIVDVECSVVGKGKSARSAARKVAGNRR